MVDKYIDNQKKMIKKQISKFLPGYLMVFFFSFLIIGALIYGMDPPPQTWKNDEIIFVNVQFRNKQRTLARYASSGYELVDQNVNLYWAGKELTWQELGKTYTIKYFMREGYRELGAVSCGDATIISEEDKIAVWEQTTGELSLLLLVCVIIIIRMSQSLNKELKNPEIQECRKRIRIYEAKTNRRARDKHRK